MMASTPLQEPTKDVTDYEIAKKCLDDHNSYAWERTAQDKRDDSIRWLEGKVRELEVRSWVLSRTLPKALQAGALRCIRQPGLSTAQPYCGQRLRCSVGPKKKKKVNSSAASTTTTTTTTTDSNADAGQ